MNHTKNTFFSRLLILLADILIHGLAISLFIFLSSYTGFLSAELVPDPLMGHSEVQYIQPEKLVEKPEDPNISIPVPKKSIRKGTIIDASKLKFITIPAHMASKMVAHDISELVGKEAKRTLHRNKPVVMSSVGSMTTIHRNDQVTVKFHKGSLEIQTIGRAMESGGEGDLIRVMNLESKKTISGLITKNGEIDVSI